MALVSTTMMFRAFTRRFSVNYPRPYQQFVSSFTTNTTVAELPPHNKLKVPDFGSKGTVIEWHKSIGDEVKEGSIMVDVSFDEFDVEIVSEVNGYLAAISAKETDGELSAGSELGIIVSDLDFIPFFSPSFSFIENDQNIVKDDLTNDINNEKKKEEEKHEKIDENKLENSTKQIIENELDMKEDFDESVNQLNDENNPSSDSNSDSSDDDNDKNRNNELKQPTISGMQMLWEIKHIASSSDLSEETIRALKELAVSEDNHLKSCFFAASSLPSAEALEEDPTATMGPLDHAEFLDLAAPLIQKVIQDKKE